MAEIARQQIEQGDATTAVLLILEVLPKSIDNPNRPLVFEAQTQLYEAISKLDNKLAHKLTGQSLIDYARKLVSGKELTQKQKEEFFLEAHVPTLLEFIEDIDPEFLETLTLEQRQKFVVNETDVLGEKIFIEWFEQLTSEQQEKFIYKKEYDETIKSMVAQANALVPPDEITWTSGSLDPDIAIEAVNAFGKCIEKKNNMKTLLTLIKETLKNLLLMKN